MKNDLYIKLIKYNKSLKYEVTFYKFGWHWWSIYFWCHQHMFYVLGKYLWLLTQEISTWLLFALTHATDDEEKHNWFIEVTIITVCLSSVAIIFYNF